jgi:glycosyltransferase involved in cell wall biosynthesis
VPRKILLLITDLEIGGTPTVVRELASRLKAPPEVEVDVACLAGWGPVAEQLREAGVGVVLFEARGARDFPGVVWQLVRLIRERKYDTVFSFLIHANAVAAAASLFCRGVRFLQSIQTTQPSPRWHWWLQSLVQYAAEKVVVPSASAAEVARESAGIDGAKIVVIPNAIDPDAFPRSAIPAADPRPYPIGFIGRLDPVKRVAWLLEEMWVLNEVSPGLATLDVFGDGVERAALEKQAHDRGMAGFVKFHGTVAQPQEALARIGMLVLRSQAEGFGLVLIEAMAAGVPVIGADVPGIRDVIRHGETGILVSGADGVTVLAFAVQRLIEDLSMRQRLIDAGLRAVRERFSWNVVLPQYRALLRLSQTSPVPRP